VPVPVPVPAAGAGPLPEGWACTGRLPGSTPDAYSPGAC
jgi:hypothetical protein